MPKVVISDTSTLILFQKIEQLELLKKLYIELLTTPEIAEEYGEELPNWIKVESVIDNKYQKLLETQVDTGEASAIALAKEYDDVYKKYIKNFLNWLYINVVFHAKKEPTHK